MRAQRSGFALLAVLVALAVLEGAVLGMLMLAAQTHAAARDDADRIRATRAAESAVRATLAAWDESVVGMIGRGGRIVPAGAAGTLPGNVAWSAGTERLGGSLWLITGEAAVSGGGQLHARSRALATVAAVPIDELWLDFHASVVSGGNLDVGSGTTIDGTNPASPPPPWSPADCPPNAFSPRPAPPLAPAGISLDAAAPLATAGASIHGTPPVLQPGPRTRPADFAGFGPLDWSTLARVADWQATGSVTLAPVAARAVCDVSAAGNAGAPEDPADPCHDFFPLIVASGDLIIDAGAGQGVLAVAGRLTISAGVRFYGAIVAGEIDAPAFELYGSLRTARGGRLGGFFRFNGCALGRAFQRPRFMRKVYRYADRLWLPSF
jgi:hypothetical protein